MSLFYLLFFIIVVDCDGGGDGGWVLDWFVFFCIECGASGEMSGEEVVKDKDANDFNYSCVIYYYFAGSGTVSYVLFVVFAGSKAVSIAILR